MLSEEAVTKFNSINLLERFKAISDAFQTNTPFENYSDDKVLELFENLGYGLKLDKKESFFYLKSKEGNYDFRLNLVLKYGIVETIIWAKNIETGEQYGGVLSRLIKLIQKSNGAKEIVSIGYPRFSNYEDLIMIISELLLIYEDFKAVWICKH